MSGAPVQSPAYDYAVPARLEATVKRVYGADASDALKKLREGKTIARGPHVFRPQRIRKMTQDEQSPDPMVTEGGTKTSPPDPAGAEGSGETSQKDGKGKK